MIVMNGNYDCNEWKCLLRMTEHNIYFLVTVENYVCLA